MAATQGSGREMGALEMCPIESATVELPPLEREAYARFAQTDLSMEDGDHCRSVTVRS